MGDNYFHFFGILQLPVIQLVLIEAKKYLFNRINWSNPFLFKFQRAIKDCKFAATAVRKLRHAVSSGPIETLNFLIKKQPNNVMRYSQRSGVVLTECDISLAYSKDQNNMLFSALLKPDLTNCDVMIPMQRSF